MEGTKAYEPPHTREERLEWLRLVIREGRYEVSDEQIAEAMLNSCGVARE